MNKFEIESKLNELKDCEIIHFYLNGSIECFAHTQELVNNADTEFLISEYDNFKAPYCAIESFCKFK